LFFYSEHKTTSAPVFPFLIHCNCGDYVAAVPKTSATGMTKAENCHKLTSRRTAAYGSVTESPELHST
jgi:hypothetical protein